MNSNKDKTMGEGQEVAPVAWMNVKYGTLFTAAEVPSTDPIIAAIEHGELVPLYAGQTSDARDAARLDFMVHRGAVIDCSYNNDKRTVYRVMAFGQSLTGWHSSYREAIDAAMRQEGDTP